MKLLPEDFYDDYEVVSTTIKGSRMSFFDAFMLIFLILLIGGFVLS